MPVYGVNLPWLHGSYGHDLAPNERHPSWGWAFDAKPFQAPIEEARALGFSAIRLWLCESGEGVVTDKSGAIRGLHPALLENLARIDAAAAERGLALYPCLLDANSIEREGDALSRAILEDRDQRQRFAEHVAAPIAKRLDAERTLALELINEPDVLSPDGVPPGGTPIEWAVIGEALATIGEAARAEGLRASAGTMDFMAGHLLAADPKLDAVDLHVYHRSGGLPPLEELRERLSLPALGTEAMPLFAGECGLPEDVEDHARLVNYLHNARPNGYAAVFLWKLEGWLVDVAERRIVTHAGKAARLTLTEKLPARDGAGP